jgi:methyltransferase
VTAVLVVVALVVAPMLIETAVSARHDRALRAQGAVEPPGDVYRIMALAYPGAFVAMIAEGALRAVPLDGWFAAGLAVFAAGKALKYWAILSLGSRWTFRVLVPPGSSRTVSGPYRWLAHPNYVAVAGELSGVALAMHAVFTGPLAVAGFGWLMWRRIQIEEDALMRASTASEPRARSEPA